MKLYHGSYLEIPRPDLEHSRDDVDFGRGFYTTLLYEQAEKWCGKFKRRGKDGFISCYSFDDDALESLDVLEFDSYSDEWLDFVLNCRRENDSSKYDVVIGGVANDKVFNTVELFVDGLIEKDEALRRLRFEEPNIQICLRTTKSLSHLRFEGSVKV